MPFASAGQATPGGRRAAFRSGLGEEVSLACRRQAGHGPTVRWRTGWGEALTGRPQALVAQEALDAFWVTDQSAQFHAATAGRTLVQGQPECQAQQVGPFDVPTPAARRRRLGGLGERRWSWGALWRRRWRWGGTYRWVDRRGRNDQRTPMGRGREHSTIDGLVLLRGRKIRSDCAASEGDAAPDSAAARARPRETVEDGLRRQDARPMTYPLIRRGWRAARQAAREVYFARAVRYIPRGPTRPDRSPAASRWRRAVSHRLPDEPSGPRTRPRQDQVAAIRAR